MFPEMTPERKAAALALYARICTTLDALREEISALPKETAHDGCPDRPVFLVAVAGQNVEPGDKGKTLCVCARRDDIQTVAINIADRLC